MDFYFEYELTIKDYEEYNVYLTKKKYRKHRWLWHFWGLAMFSVGVFELYRIGFIPHPLWIALLPLSIYIFTLPWLLLRTARRNMRQMIAKARPGTIVGIVKITIDEAAIHSVGNLSQSIIQWGAVQEVEATPKYVYIYLSSHAALIVPCHIIGNQQAVDDLMGFIRTQIDRSYNKEEIAQHLV